MPELFTLKDPSFCLLLAVLLVLVVAPLAYAFIGLRKMRGGR